MSGLLKLGRKGVFSRPAVRVQRHVPWASLTFRYTDPKARERLAQMQSRFAEVQGLYATVPKEIPDIDWGHWKKTIKTPGVVDKMKSFHDEQMKKLTKLDASEDAARKSAQDSEIRAVDAKAEVGKQFLTELKDEIAWTEHWYNNPEEVVQGTWISWNEHKRDHMYPNYKIHRVNRYLFGQNPARAEARTVNRVNAIDLSELRRQLNEGNIRAYGAVAQILKDETVESLQALQRPFFKKWLKPIDFDEAVKDPTKSLVYRAYALQRLLKGQK